MCFPAGRFKKLGRCVRVTSMCEQKSTVLDAVTEYLSPKSYVYSK